MRLIDRSSPFTLPGYPDFLARLLHARGVNDVADAGRFLHPDVSQLRDPLSIYGMGKAVSLIRQAAQSGVTAAVYGDYDADGVCASAILLDALRQLGLAAFPYIPDRVAEGYGLHADAIRSLSGKAGLIITVDCGVTAADEAALARELGITLVITDHHTLPDKLPDADAVVHPGLGDSTEPGLCGAGVAWKLACALIGLENAMPLLELAALATVADLVPLLGENRVIAALGLNRLAGTARPGLRALKAVAGLKDGAPVTGDAAGYQLAPRLNAGGRLASARLALDLLTAESLDAARPLAAQLDALNRERREVETAVVKAASEQVAAMDLSALRSLVACAEGWNPGVIGLAAGKLAQKWNYPAVVLTRENDMLHGSGRSAGNVDLHAALSDCAGLFHRFGGHRMAAGLTMPAINLEAFRARFDEAVKAQLGNDDLFPETPHDGKVDIREVSLKNADALALLEPCGMGNPAPRFLLQDVRLFSARAVGNGGAHLKVSVEKGGEVREGIAFGMGGYRPGGNVNVVAGIARNEYNGYVAPQLTVRAILPGKTAFTPDPVREAYALLRELAHFADSRELAEPVSQMPGIPSRGILIACRLAETANVLRKAKPDLAVCIGVADDPRAFSAVLHLPDWDRSHAGFHTVILADGELHPGEAARAKAATGAARVRALPKNPALNRMLESCRVTLDELREAYLALRSGGEPRLTMQQSLAARMVLEEMGLVKLDSGGNLTQLLPAAKVDPETSKLFQALKK